MYDILKPRMIYCLLKFVRNQHFIQNNDLFGQYLFWGRVG